MPTQRHHQTPQPPPKKPDLLQNLLHKNISLKMIAFLLFAGCCLISVATSESSKKGRSKHSQPTPQTSKTTPIKNETPVNFKKERTQDFSYGDFDISFSEYFISDHNGTAKPAKGNVYLTIPYYIYNKSNRTQKDPMSSLLVIHNNNVYKTRNAKGETSYAERLKPKFGVSQWQTVEVDSSVTEGNFQVRMRKNKGADAFSAIFDPSWNSGI